MREKSRQFLRVFNHVYYQWFRVSGHEVQVDNEPLTDEELEIAAEISNYLEELFYKITDEKNGKNQDRKAVQ